MSAGLNILQQLEYLQKNSILTAVERAIGNDSIRHKMAIHSHEFDKIFDNFWPGRKSGERVELE